MDDNVPTGEPTEEPAVIWYHAVFRLWVIDDTPTITVDEAVPENQEGPYDAVQQEDEEEERPVIQAVAYALN